MQSEFLVSWMKGILDSEEAEITNFEGSLCDISRIEIMDF